MKTASMKIPILEIIKWMLVILVVLFVVSQLSGNKQSATAFDTMKEAVLSEADLSLMQEGDNQMIKRLYGLDPNSFDGVMLYYPVTNMGAEEILLVKLSNTAQQEEVRAAIEARIATQMDSFEGYGVDQYELLQASITDVQGNYILLIVGANASEVDKAFQKAL